MNTKTIVLTAVLAIAVVAGAAYLMNTQSSTEQTASAETESYIDTTIAPAFGEATETMQNAADETMDAAEDAMDSMEETMNEATDEMSHEMDEMTDEIQ